MKNAIGVRGSLVSDGLGDEKDEGDSVEQPQEQILPAKA